MKAQLHMLLMQVTIKLFFKSLAEKHEVKWTQGRDWKGRRTVS